MPLGLRMIENDRCYMFEFIVLIILPYGLDIGNVRKQRFMMKYRCFFINYPQRAFGS